MQESTIFPTRSNVSNLSEICSYLKKSWLILLKELTLMKKKNDALSKQVQELETTMFYIFDRTITKEDMKEIMGEKLLASSNIFQSQHPKITKEELRKLISEGFTNILKERAKAVPKETVKKDTFNDIATMSQIYSYNTEKAIKSIKLCKRVQNQHPSAVTCLLELLDGRIVMACYGGAISLNHLNYETKEWKVLTQKNKLHDGNIHSLCELSNKRIISSSEDKTIKIWNISSNDEIKLIKKITQHKGEVSKVISLTNNRFASCSDDCTVKSRSSENFDLINDFEKLTYPNSLL